MTDRIELRGLRVSAVIGVLDEERERAQPLQLDLELERNFLDAALSDDVTLTTDYAAVSAVAVEVATTGRFLLLETLAHRVAREVLALDEAIEAVTVSVAKLRPPVPQDLATAGVRCRVSR